MAASLLEQLVLSSYALGLCSNGEYPLINFFSIIIWSVAGAMLHPGQVALGVTDGVLSCLLRHSASVLRRHPACNPQHVFYLPASTGCAAQLQHPLHHRTLRTPRRARLTGPQVCLDARLVLSGCTARC